MKNKKIIIYFLVIAVVGLFFYQFKDELLEIHIVKPIYILPIILASFAIILVNGLINFIILKSYSLSIPFLTCVGLAGLSALGNLVIPMRGGSVSNAVYLKKKFKFSYSKFLSSLSALYVVIFWVSSVCGLLGVLLLRVFYNIGTPWDLALFFLIIFVTLSSIIIFSPTIPLTKYSFINKFISVVNNWNSFNQDRKSILYVAIATILNILIGTVLSYSMFQLIGETVNLFKLAIYTIFSGFSILISFTPGNLGIKETFAIYSASTLGIALPLVLVVSIVERLASLLVSLLVSIVFIKKSQI